jgi:hypothetical protein
MSEAPLPTEEPSAIAPKLTQPFREMIRALIIVAVALVVILILIWTGRMQTKRAEETAYRNMGDALAQSMVPILLERNWSKAEQQLGRIAEAGNFSEITLTDVEGRLLASTNRSPIKPESLRTAPDAARVSMEPGNVRIERKVWLAQGNALGAVRFLIRR